MSPPRSDDRFRRQLADLLEGWVEQGLIEPAQRDRLREYYRLEDLQRSAASRFTLLLLVFGGLLLGLGVITFIAANWGAIPRSVRALGSLALLVGLQVAGFRVWQRGSWRLGSTLLIVGQLTLGACIGLMAQWFQIGGSPSGLFLAWGLGSLAMAYALRHAPSGVLACLLLALAAATNLWEWDTAYLHPWLAVGLLVPLAYWCRSRWVFALAVVNLSLGLQKLAGGLYDFSPSSGLWHLLGIAVVWGLGLWHQRYGPQLGRVLGRDPAFSRDSGTESLELEQDLQDLDFAPTAERLALLGLGFLLYFWSFRWVWEELPPDSPSEVGAPWAWLSAAGLLLLALWGWWQGWQMRGAQPLPARIKNATVLACLLSLALLLWLGSGAVPLNLTAKATLAFWAPWLVTLLLAWLSAVLCWEGLQRGQRWPFWQGLLGLTLLVITRFFEYETGLLLKSAVLVASGIGVILVGLQFERRLPGSPITSQLRHNS